MQSQIPFFQQWLLAFLVIFTNAAATLPLISVLGLVAGRRGNGNFCLQGSLLLVKFSFWLALCGPLYFLCACLFQILPFLSRGGDFLPTLFSIPGLPFTTSIAAWILGIVLLCLGYRCLLLRSRAIVLDRDRYTLAVFKLPIALLLCAAFVFFTTFILSNWPFAGLPQGLPWDRAIMAIIRNATRHYFMAFCPAGALALLIPLYCQARTLASATYSQRTIARRWLAFWAAIGFLPHVLQKWGLIIGLWMRGNLGNVHAMHAEVMALVMLTVAIICWFWLLLAQRAPRALAAVGLVLLLCRPLAPWFAAHLPF